MGQHILILGGGIIGLSCAFELRQRGHCVTVLEIGRCGGQASGAAAGMLAPYSENVEGPDEFFYFCLSSLDQYPTWQEDVKRISGLDFEYNCSGSLYAVYHEADLSVLEGRLSWQRYNGSTGEIVLGEALKRIEPGLSPEVIAGLYTPEESHIYTPHYIHALEVACRKLGVVIHEHLGHVKISGLLDGSSANSSAVMSQDKQHFEGDCLVICSGAWVKEMEELLMLRLPVSPIRGQICAYRAGKEDKQVKGMVFSSQGYVVGKGNGSIVCGASEDLAGFDTSVTTKGITRLSKWSCKLFPFLTGEIPFHEWAGLRPATLDGRPLIGEIPNGNTMRLLIAAGHYRNGILLSPATARMIADILENNQSLDTGMVQAFAPHRFGCQSRCYSL